MVLHPKSWLEKNQTLTTRWGVDTDWPMAFYAKPWPAKKQTSIPVDSISLWLYHMKDKPESKWIVLENSRILIIFRGFSFDKMEFLLVNIKAIYKCYSPWNDTYWLSPYIISICQFTHKLTVHLELPSLCQVGSIWFWKHSQVVQRLTPTKEPMGFELPRPVTFIFRMEIWYNSSIGRFHGRHFRGSSRSLTSI